VRYEVHESRVSAVERSGLTYYGPPYMCLMKLKTFSVYCSNSSSSDRGRNEGNKLRLYSAVQIRLLCLAP